jgi:hypothetical protein
MSLGTKTKCDLCYDTAKLDITALDKQLRYRFFSLVQQIHDITGVIGNVVSINAQHQQIFETACTKSNTLHSLIEQLAITAELADTIQNTKSTEDHKVIRDIQCVNLLSD